MESNGHFDALFAHHTVTTTDGDSGGKHDAPPGHSNLRESPLLELSDERQVD